MIKPYTKNTTISLWTDEYIAKKMLEAHIDPKSDAASRKHETIVKTVDFIETLITKNMRICDYGCGPGLYTDLLNKRSYNVIGVDVSTNSLEYARSMNKNVKYIQMNYITDEIPYLVDFAMMIYCDFGALDDDSRIKVLKNIGKKLNKDGYFFFDVLSTKWFDRQKADKVVYNEHNGFFMAGNAQITKTTSLYPERKISLTHYLVKGDKTIEFYNWSKCFDREDISLLLKNNGFEVVDIYSDTYGSKDFNDNDVYAVLAKKIKQN